MSSPRSLGVAYLLALTPVLGWSGAHRLYLGQLPQVWLYSETMGFFLFGWIRDLFRMRRLVTQANLSLPAGIETLAHYPAFSRSEFLGMVAAAWIGVVPRLTPSFPPTRFMAGQRQFMEMDALDAAQRESDAKAGPARSTCRVIRRAFGAARRTFGPQIRFALLEPAFGAALAANSGARKCAFLGIWAGAVTGTLLSVPLNHVVRLAARWMQVDSRPVSSAVDYATLVSGRALGAALIASREAKGPGLAGIFVREYSTLAWFLTRSRLAFASFRWVSSIVLARKQSQVDG